MEREPKLVAMLLMASNFTTCMRLKGKTPYADLSSVEKREGDTHPFLNGRGYCRIGLSALGRWADNAAGW